MKIETKFDVNQEVWCKESSFRNLRKKEKDKPFKCKITAIIIRYNEPTLYELEYLCCLDESELFATREEAEAELKESMK